MRLIRDCDADTLYMALSEIGINMRDPDKKDPSVQYLRELYGFLLHAQLLAWKSGKSHRQLIRSANHALLELRPISKDVDPKK